MSDVEDTQAVDARKLREKARESKQISQDELEDILTEPELAESLEDGPTIEFLTALAGSTGSHILAGLLVRTEAGMERVAALSLPMAEVYRPCSKSASPIPASAGP